ncbi:MAG: C-terminal binding protein [Candidatus Velthaea sp.]
MTRRRVVYIDPLWAVGTDGRVDPASASVERGVFGEDIDIAFGDIENGTYIRQGPRAEERVRGADALVVSRAHITPHMIEALLPTCKVVGRSGIGFDNLNPPLLRAHGIFGFNVPDYCVDEVSTHTVALLLALERKLTDLDGRIKAGRWNTYDGPAPRRTMGLTLGLIGFGNIGRATTRKAQAFFRSVVAYDPYVHADLMAGMGVVKCATLADLIATSDSVAVHALLNDETRRMVNRTALSVARPGTLLVNTARGDIVEPEAVLEALDDGRLGGYGSDVFTPENPLEHPVNAAILRQANVIVTPHSAFRSSDAEISQRRRVAEQVLHVLRTGEPPSFGRQA